MKHLYKSLLALLLAALILLTACSAPPADQPSATNTSDSPVVPQEDKPKINIPNLEETVTEDRVLSFSATFTQNDYDSFPDTYDGAHFTDGVNTYVSNEGYLDLMPILKELVDDIKTVGSVEVSVKASDTSRWTNTKNNNEIKPTYQFHKNDRSGPSIKTVRANESSSEPTVFTVSLADDATGLIFLPYGFNPEAGKVTFEITFHAVITAKYTRAYEESVVLLTASDFQCWGDEAVTVPEQMAAILDNIDDSIKFDGFLFCGDYDAASVNDTKETERGLKALDEFISPYIVDDDKIYVKGNHDAIIDGISESGANDAEEYGVFVINESDYMWYNSDEQTVKLAAQNLIEYLNGKLEEGYEKPIFVVSHLPLHYTMRTRQDGDGRYAHYFFDALNEAGEKGLNLFFLYGHDHSNSWDDYLGASAVYLAKGDNINISYGKKEEFKEKTLNFTYMNAGFIGYYDRNNEGAHDALTMCIIEITDSTVAVARVSQSGIALLKAKGVRNEYKNEIYYDPDERVITSYQEIELTKVKKKSPIKDIYKEEKVEAPKEAHYIRIEKADELKDGGKYLIVVQQRGSSDTFVMTPNVVTKSGGSGTRVGFELLSAPDFDEAAVISPDLDAREWTFTKSGDGWMLGTDGKYVHLEQTQDKAITATLEDAGDVFSVKKDGSKFAFSNGEFYLNHNTSRSLVNGYASEPAYIYIYEYVD